ncbi:MAG: hypothetical protein L6V93_14030 [Clostridiales bacterium]|nr:MAG: hypothetical protein L6V93_14030 [Clostridiales bacterium]
MQFQTTKTFRCRRKKAWLSERFDDGLVFIKAPSAENALLNTFLPRTRGCRYAPTGFMYIDCLWVSGAFKGARIFNRFARLCRKRQQKNKGKKGMCILSSAKNVRFLPTRNFWRIRVFAPCDESSNGIEFLVSSV